MNKEYAIAIVTPDAVQDNLEGIIVHDLIKEAQLQIIWKKYWKIEKGDIKIIYPRMVDKPFYPSIVRNMTSGKSLVLLVKGENIYNRLQEIKGEFKILNNRKIKLNGLRFKYRARSTEEIVLNYEDEKLLDKVFKFRIHTADNIKETAIICSLCMDPWEIEKLKNLSQILYSEIKQFKVTENMYEK